jgi:hypothetical protein
MIKYSKYFLCQSIKFHSQILKFYLPLGPKYINLVPNSIIRFLNHIWEVLCDGKVTSSEELIRYPRATDPNY